VTENPEQTHARVLLLTPTARDAEVTAALLKPAKLESVACSSMAELIRELERGAAAALLTEEALTLQHIDDLLRALQNQPPWSDFPVVMLMRGGGQSPTATSALQSLRNVTLLEWPAAMRSVLSAVQAAVRARFRQYQIRELLESERAARASAEDANRIKDEFVANVSHELRTPLNAVLGWAQILRDNPNDPAELAEGLETIERNARVQAQLIEDLLDISRIVSGNIRLDLRPIDPLPAVQGAIESTRTEAKAHGVEIETAIEPSALIVGDPARLQQIVWNLLANAIKFTPKSGRVLVSLRNTATDLQITVTDTGVGIAPQFLPHVFERFRQADASTTRRYGGLGLGLAIVKQLVELQGGGVTASSPGVGNGSTFVVTLPLVHSPNRFPEKGGLSPQTSNPSDGIAAELAGIKVLLVDDDADSRAMMKRMLTGHQAQVITAASASEALKLLSEIQPDVLLSDISMPEIDGYELIRRIRSMIDQPQNQLPAVALTAFARPEDRDRALRAGFQGHVAKPVEPAALIATITELSAPIRATNSASHSV
jgi:signal transduction histidine kinase/ActR/RegA family two-component response regulator